MTDTVKLRQLASAATPGPWESEAAATRVGALHRVTYAAAADGMNAGARFVVANAEGTEGNDRNNAAFIAAANPATFLAMLDEIDRLRAKVSDMRSERLRVEDQLAKVTRDRDSYANSGFERQLTEARDQLAAMTGARDEACDGWERWIDESDYPHGEYATEHRTRIDELRKVGAK